uniref:Histone-lysine N-methyltransferase ASHH2 n=1 Tax=Cajanus cajan TaxID=3821 RepID=A0A151TSF4_CAJCA|nr:Histone-lysine N-methyltransferase ASHH2 [Cajanus cajan]
MRRADPLLNVVEKCDALIGTEADGCGQVSPSPAMEGPSGALYTDKEIDSTSDQPCDWKEGEDKNSTCEEKVKAFVDEETNISSCAKILSSPGCCRTVGRSPVVDSPSPAMEADACRLITPSPVMEVPSGAICTVTEVESRSDQPCEALVTNYSSKDVPDLHCDDVSINNNNNVVDNPGKMNNDGKEDVEVNCINESIPLPSQRNRRRTQFGRKTQTKKASKKCKNKAKETHSSEGMELKAARKKRSHFPNTARNSMWGSGNIEQFFEQDNELGVGEAARQELGKAKSKRQSGKTVKNGASSSSISPVQKCPVLTTRVRLKIKFGKEVDLNCSNVLIPESVDGLASAFHLGSDSSSQKVARNAEDKISEAVALGNSESFNNELDKDGLVLNGQVANNPPLEDTEITKKSGEYTEEPCIAVPPGKVVEALIEPINNKGMDPGTSPDSEVINSIPEVQVGERQQEDVHHAVLGSSKKLNPEVDVILNKRGRKKDKLISSSNCITEDGSQEFPASENLLCSARPLGRKLPKRLRPSKVSKTKSKASDSTGRKKSTCTHKEKQKKPINKNEVKGKGVSLNVTCEAEDRPHPEVNVGNHKLDAVGKINADNNRVSVNLPNLDMPSGVGLGEQLLSPRNAWVRCDDCLKWRRIPAGLADLIDETNCTWTCADSSDKAFADCAIPQEKSNAEINAELGLSDASGEEDAYEGCRNFKELEYRPPFVSQESSFTHIFTNEFLHRSHKSQTIDEIMVCHCKPPQEGKFGCGDECLNRILNIECVQGTCPCGDRCSNQQFQKRKYACLKWFKCGKKGYGLKAIENVAQGQFLIEYVGEVLDMQTYEARQREYALKGHRHFYFMTLNGSEVIDASAKGNLGRFINHSCDPNCRTEKWMVNGEICIGLFALRDIKQDEELTFDYNYVRVFGAAAKKCYCGSPNCRGYIGGGDPLAELVVQSDSEDEFPEPVMLTEDVEMEDKAKLPSSVQDEESNQQMEDETSKPMPAVQGNEKESDFADKTSSLQRFETTSPLATVSKMLPNSTGSIRESKSEIIEGRKTSKLNGSVKKGKLHANPPNGLKSEVIANRLQVSSIKHKKVEGSSNGRFEAVQEKLNELLDGDGGISKRKDATKGYLKLLFLTVASGDRSNGEAIQSNRDLSMILDALLKTKSRAVLNDIINKNDGVETKGARKRKRKSRWDQPAETNSHSDAVMSSIGESQNIYEDVPPGFSCPIVIGHPKEKFNSRLPISYGMPWSVAQQYGTPHAEFSECWVTAPGMPFNPFPPLPPYPRDKDYEMIPSTTGANPEDSNLLFEDNKHITKRLKGDSNDLGTRYFRQQKWNNSKIHRPWFRKNAWECNENNSSGDMCSIDVDVPKESKVTCDAEDAICREEKGGNNIY